jgi:hypothetical protein
MSHKRHKTHKNELKGEDGLKVFQRSRLLNWVRVGNIQGRVVEEE